MTVMCLHPHPHLGQTSPGQTPPRQTRSTIGAVRILLDTVVFYFKNIGSMSQWNLNTSRQKFNADKLWAHYDTSLFVQNIMKWSNQNFISFSSCLLVQQLLQFQLCDIEQSQVVLESCQVQFNRSILLSVLPVVQSFFWCFQMDRNCGRASCQSGKNMCIKFDAMDVISLQLFMQISNY